MWDHSCVCVRAPSHVCLWNHTKKHEVPLSVEYSRQKYWDDCHFLHQGFFLTQGSNMSPALAAAAAVAKSLQSCPTLCDPIDSSSPGSPVPGILQARTLEWVAISFSNAWRWEVKGKSLSHVRLLVTPWTAAYQAPPSMGFARQQYWNRVPLPFFFSI